MDSSMDWLVKTIFTILGVGMLLPWNTFVSADNYFESRLCFLFHGNHNVPDNQYHDDDDESESGGESGNFMLWMGLIYNLSNVATLGILLWIQKRRRKRRAFKKQQEQFTALPTTTSATTTTTAATYNYGINGRHLSSSQLGRHVLSKETNAAITSSTTTMTTREEDNDVDDDEEDFHMNDACSLHTTPIRVQDVLEVDAGMSLFEDDQEEQGGRVGVGVGIGRNSHNRLSTIMTRQDLEIRKAQILQRRMIILPFTIILVIMCMTTIIVTVPNTSPSLFLLLTLVGTFLCGSCGAFVSAGVVSFSSIFDSNVGIQPFISGQALGGTLISILNLVFSALTSHSIDPFWEEHCQGMDLDMPLYSEGVNNEDSSQALILPSLYSEYDIMSSVYGRMLQDENDGGKGCAEYLIDWGAFNYFAISSIFTVLCLYLYNYLDHQPQTNIRRAIANQGNDETIPSTSTTLQRQYHQQHQQHEFTNPINLEEEEGQVESLEQMRRTALFGDESIWTSNWTSEEAEISGVTQHHFISNSAGRSSLSQTPSQEEQNRSYQSINPPDGGIAQEPKHVMTGGGGSEEEVVTNLTSFVWSRVRLPALSIFFTFFVTLSIFPAYWTTIQSVKQCESKEDRWNNDLFAITSIVSYNVADLAGRMCTSSINTHTHRFPQKLLFWSVVRFISFPLFLLCNSGGGGGGGGGGGRGGESDATSDAHFNLFLSTMNLFYTDAYSRLLMLVFGFSNGFISSLAFTCTPPLIPSKEEYQTVASTILNFALGIGLLGGSLFSFLYSSFASGEW